MTVPIHFYIIRETRLIYLTFIDPVTRLYYLPQ